jgi:FtsX-like permease family protein
MTVRIMKRLVLGLVFVLIGACTSSTPVTRAEAERDFCADLVSVSPRDGTLPEPVMRRLLADADLFDRAGDHRTAQGIRRIVNGLRLIERLRREKKAMVVFLEDGLTDSQIDTLRDSLTKAPGVVSVRFESKADALARFRRLFADHPDLVSNVSEEALPASFHVRVASSDMFDQLASSAESMPGVDRVNVDESGLGDAYSQVFDLFVGSKPAHVPRCLRPFPPQSP